MTHGTLNATDWRCRHHKGINSSQEFEKTTIINVFSTFPEFVQATVNENTLCKILSPDVFSLKLASIFYPVFKILLFHPIMSSTKVGSYTFSLEVELPERTCRRATSVPEC